MTKKKNSKKGSKKSVAQIKAEAQAYFNLHIRERDKGRPCISCGEYKKLQAGHYWGVHGYDALRFDLDNAHGECERCNRFDGSHLIRYGANLKKKIGSQRLKALNAKADQYDSGALKKITRAQAQEVLDLYKNLYLSKYKGRRG